MATFIPGITDAIPSRLNFKPDWNRVERGLMLRSAAYQEGARQVKSLYDSVFQSPMLRDGNIQRRDAYLKQISEGLKNVSALDLSILSNQQSAMQLFDPLQNDKAIMKDIVWTKGYLQASNEAERLRTSSDPTQRRQYWDTGMKYLQYQAEDFAKADDDTALSMSKAKYVPNVDLVSLADKMYKDMGISVQEDVINGGYIWTKKNGDIAVPLTQSMVNNLFSQDPAVQDMLRVKAVVMRKDFIKQNAAKYGSEEAAEKVYINDILKTVGVKQQEQVAKDSDEVKDLRARKESWNKVITERGIIPGSDEHKRYLEDIGKLEAAESAAKNSRDQAAIFTTMNPDDNNDLRAAADQAVVMANYIAETNRVATLLAYKNTSVSAKTDPVYMAKLNSQLSLNRSLVLENVRQMNKIAFMDEQLKRGITPGAKGGKTDPKKAENNATNNLWGPYVNPGATNSTTNPWNFNITPGSNTGASNSGGQTASDPVRSETLDLLNGQ